VGSKKRKTKGSRPGLSGNPQRRAEQLGLQQELALQRQEAAGLTQALADYEPPDLSPLLSLARTLAGGAEPSPWWPESHGRILDAARTRTWPASLVEVETQTCRIVGDEFYDRFDSPEGGLNPPQWLCALAEETGAALRESVKEGSEDWRPLQALLCGLALIAPPGQDESHSEHAIRARAFFPDIKGPRTTTAAEVSQVATFLADHGLTPGLEYPPDGCQPTGEPLLARDAYGSRFLLVAPFGYGEAPDHWYAWDVDTCWLGDVVAAGVFGSPQDALAEWRDAVGPAAAEADLSPATLDTAADLLESCLRTGPMSDTLQGIEPRAFIREYYRLRRRAHDLVGAERVQAIEASSGPPDLISLGMEFVDWYAPQHADVPREDIEAAADIILDHWGPVARTGEDWGYACSPHRIEMAARLIRDQYSPDAANAALRLLPEWTRWCIERSGITGDLAAWSRGAALTESRALVDPEARDRTRTDEPAYRRAE
jgi:hypothetical protein